MRTRALRRSLASATRVTIPASVRLATILVMVGGCTCSMAASSPSVGLPCRLHRAERRGLGRRETAEGLLAQPPLQPVDGDAQAAGHLFVGQLGRAAPACPHYS